MDRKRVSKHIFASILITLSIYFLIPVLYAIFAAPYWHLMNDNVVRYGGREFEIPPGWVAADEYGYFWVEIPKSPWEDSSVSITFTLTERTLSGPLYYTEKDLKTQLQGKIDFMTEEGYHGFEPIDVPLPDTISLCAVGKSNRNPRHLQGYCFARGQVYYYFFEGPPEFLPIIKEIVANAKNVKSAPKSTTNLT